MIIGTVPPDHCQDSLLPADTAPATRTAEHLVIPAIDVRLDDRVPDIFGDYARQRLRRVAERSSSPITAICIRLSNQRESALADPFIAQANITTTRQIRVQVTGATAHAAVDALQARTWTRLQTFTAGNPIQGQRCVPLAQTLLYLQPIRQRSVMRTKFFHLYRRTPLETAVDMALMDHTFELFNETGAATDSVLYRTSHGNYRLTRLDPRPHSAITGNLPIGIDDAPAPELDRQEAIARLSLSGLPFLFYRDHALDRGCVLYHRYDGHYGFISSQR